MAALDHPLVRAYLDQLHQETVRLRVPEGRELETQIREHLTEALGDDPSEADVRHTLERLGEPAELVDAAGGSPPPHLTPTLPPERTRAAWRETGALVLLVGAMLVFWFPPVAMLMWLVGLVLLALAPRWSVAEKLWGAVVLGAGPVLAVIAGLAAWRTTSCAVEVSTTGEVITSGDCSSTALPTWAVVALGLAFLGLLVWTVIHLARAAARQDVVDYSARDAAARQG